MLNPRADILGGLSRAVKGTSDDLIHKYNPDANATAMLHSRLYNCPVSTN